MKKRTNSVISSLYHPSIGNSRFKTAACMFFGGVVLVCLGVGLIVVTTVERPQAAAAARSHVVDETSVLISGPTCLALGLVVAVLSGADMCRHRRARNSVESELNRAMGGAKEPIPDQYQTNHRKVSIVINKALWPS